MDLRIICKSKFVSDVRHSYGIMLYYPPDDAWLIVQRKQSLNFLLLLRGNYNLADIPAVVSGITRDEMVMTKDVIKSLDNYLLCYTGIYGKPPLYPGKIWSKICVARPLIEKSLVKYSDNDNQLQWLWPKGFVNMSEQPYLAAVRELEEETGVKLTDYLMNSSTVEYTQTGLDGFTYTAKCWCCITKDKTLLNTVESEEIEVKNRAWISTKDVLLCLPTIERDAFIRAVNIVNQPDGWTTVGTGDAFSPPADGAATGAV